MPSTPWTCPGTANQEGRRCYVPRFSEYELDVRLLHTMLRRTYPRQKIFLLGHSMGGTIAVAYAAKYQDDLAGLILSSAALKPGDSVTRVQIIMAKLLSVIAPTMGVAALDASTVSRDHAVVEAYVNDPLVHRGPLCARLGAEMIDVMRHQIPRDVTRITIPTLAMYGSGDRLTNPGAIAHFHETVIAQDKTLKRYEGLYHELFNEPERLQVLADVEAWLAARL